MDSKKKLLSALQEQLAALDEGIDAMRTNIDAMNAKAAALRALPASNPEVEWWQRGELHWPDKNLASCRQPRELLHKPSADASAPALPEDVFELTWWRNACQAAGAVDEVAADKPAL